MSGPQSSQQVVIDTSNPCYLPDLGNGDSIPMIDISGNNDTCLANLNLHTDDGKTCYIIIILPNKAPVKVYLGTVSVGSDGSFTIGRWYSIGEIKVVGPYGPLTQETSDFIDGIKEAFEFMGNSINGLLSGKDVFEAINYMNQYLTKYQWEVFSKVTSNYDVKDQRIQFMKHAIIGGYIASKMRNFSDATGTPYADEGRMNFEIGFWVSFYAERATTWYNTKFNTNYTIPLFSTADEMGLIAIAELVKILSVAEHSHLKRVNEEKQMGNPLAFLQENAMNVTSLPHKSEDGWWLFNGYVDKSGKTLIPAISFSGLEHIGVMNRFTNVGLGVRILFNKLQEPKATGEDPTFSHAQSLLAWLKAARLYNGDTTTPGSETYNHSLKLIELYEILYGDSITSWNRKYLDDFEDWVRNGAKYPQQP
jgi:hypothetical protein